jgi:hypothetical protein
MSSSDLLDEFGVLGPVDVLGKGDGLDRHPERDLLAVHALDVVETGLVGDVLSRQGRELNVRCELRRTREGVDQVQGKEEEVIGLRATHPCHRT